jgi:1-acyl-sn-glycerol-3-phosphate acyltransferase
MTQKLAKFLVFLFMRLAAHVDIDGLENQPHEGGFIVASNHLGRLDVPLAYVFLNRNDITLMVAEKYHKYAIFRWFVKNLDGLWVDRYNADFNTVRAALYRLKQGGVLVIAPEGTRSKTEALIEAWSGSSFLAAKTGSPIMPVALTGTEDRLVMQQIKRLRRPRIHVQVGKPFTLPPIKGQDRQQVLQQYTNEIMCQIAALLPPEKRGFYADHPRTQELLKGNGICSA